MNRELPLSLARPMTPAGIRRLYEYRRGNEPGLTASSGSKMVPNAGLLPYLSMH